MNILEKIIADKYKEVANRKAMVSILELQDSPMFNRSKISLASSIKSAEGAAIIAEFKRKSPSKGIINDRVHPADITKGYQNAGAAGLSILTDFEYFGGSTQDIVQARPEVTIPILRKEFIVDAYQLYEAAAMGADAILLIAAVLSKAQVHDLAEVANSLGLEVLLELHAEAELDHVCQQVQLVGINNRNLKNFEVNLEHSIQMAKSLPAEKLKIAESGIHSAEAAVYLKHQGFDGFLIGEHFMKQTDPTIAIAEFRKDFETLLHAK